MKNKVIVCSILFGLTFPTDAFAITSSQRLIYASDSAQLSLSRRFEIAQQPHLNSQYVVSALYDEESQILNIARGYSNDVRWESVSVDMVGRDSMRLNVHARISRPGKNGSLRVGLHLRRDNQGYFRFVNYDYETSRCRRPCQRRVRNGVRGIPNEYSRFNQVLDDILC